MIRRALLVLALVVFAAVARGQSGLYPFTIDQDALGGAPDFSALNKPLTAADAHAVRYGWRHPPDHERTPSVAQLRVRRPAAHLSGRA